MGVQGVTGVRGQGKAQSALGASMESGHDMVPDGDGNVAFALLGAEVRQLGIEVRLLVQDIHVLRDCWQIEHDRVQAATLKLDRMPELEERIKELDRRDRMTAVIAALAGAIVAGGWRLIP